MQLAEGGANRRVGLSAPTTTRHSSPMGSGGASPVGRPRRPAGAERCRRTCASGPPIARPSKIVCIGLNFRDHAAESGMAGPAEPVIFFKSTHSPSGPNDDVVIPQGRRRSTGKSSWPS